MKHFMTAVTTFFATHVLCCGVLLTFLMSSGYLLLLRQEADKRWFLLPMVLLGTFFFWMYYDHGKYCKEKGEKTISDHFWLVILYIAFSGIASMVFIVYIFIPWWIPNYKGGTLLP